MWVQAVTLFIVLSASAGDVISWFGSSKTDQSVIQDFDHETSLRKAINWLLSKRQADYGWADDTARVAVALAFANVGTIKDVEREVMMKQLSLHVLKELIRNRTLDSLPLPKLAQYVNALLATCYNPQNFHGKDLVQTLRNKISRKDSNSAVTPAIVLTLCLANQTRPEDWETIYLTAYSITNRDSKRLIKRADLEAYTAIASACMFQSSGQQRGSPNVLLGAFNTTLKEYNSNTKGKTDVYTLALLLQAVNAWSSNFSGDQIKDMKSALLNLQMEDGSFGDILATYYAIPVLAGNSLLSLRNVDCRKVIPKRIAPLLSSPLPAGDLVKVSISLWISKKDEVENHTSKFAVEENWTLFEAMKSAASKNSLFMFEAEETVKGKVVYKISDIANDSERKKYWRLYPNIGNATKPNLQSTALGINKIPVQNDGHFLFWYKT